MARRTLKSTSPTAHVPQDIRVASPHSISCQTVVTHVTAHDNAPLLLAPILPGFYRLSAAAMLAGISLGNLRVILHRYRDRFDRPHYQHVKLSSKQHRFPRRLLTARDVETLRAMFPIVVK
jgi:hypothetical protein